MAYVKKEDLVIINVEAGNLQALVTDIQFRRFRRTWKDKKTGEKKYKLKSVPYAVCLITGSPLPEAKFKVGGKFIIAGYKLRNHAMQGKKCLVLNNQYIGEFEKDGASWVVDMIAESNKKKAREAAK